MGRVEGDNFPLLSAAQMRLADKQAIDSGEVTARQLMERAGQAAADAVRRCADDGGRIVVLCGTGNNGGDGFVTARLLRIRRIPVTAIPLIPVEDYKGEAAEQMESARKAGVKIRPATGVGDLDFLVDWLKRAAMVVDAIFGTGLDRPLEGWMAEVVACVNRSDRQILSIDIPSGIHADNGEELGVAIRADFTLPIAAYKWGHWLNPGNSYAGRLLEPASIGISDQTLCQVMDACPSSARASFLISHTMIRSAFPPRPVDAHKKSFGHLWVLGGSTGYTGAPRLAAAGALAAGVGLVSITCPDDVYPIIAGSSLEVMVHSESSAPCKTSDVRIADAIVAGPGWGCSCGDRLRELLAAPLPAVLDADALNAMAADESFVETLRGREALTVLTPHPGEAGRLLGSSSAAVQQDRFSAALQLAEKYHAWVVLKGARTLVVSPDLRVWLCPFGSANLATAGTGDVLAGMVGALLAATIPPEEAIPAVVGLHAVAGEQKGWHRAGQLENVIASLLRDMRS